MRPQQVSIGDPLRGNGRAIMSPAPVNIGIIGCGERARRYLQAGGELLRCVACCDLRREAAEALRSEWHFGAAYTDPVRLLRRNDIDLVLLLTPPSAYTELIPAAARSGKHIYLEGPWVAPRETVQKALEACQSAAVHLGMAHPRRALPRIIAAKRVLESGLLGTPFLVHWETAHLHHGSSASGEPASPSLLSEALAPEIDVLCFLVQQPVREVYARAGRAPFRPEGEGETWAALTLTLGQGVIAQMFHSWDCQSEQRAIEGRFHLECTQGALFVNEEGPDTVAAYLALQRAWLRPDLPEFGAEIRRSLQDFIERLSEGVEAEPLAADQLQALEVTWAIAESLKRNAPVAVPSPVLAEPSAPPETGRAAPTAPPARARRRFRRARLSPEALARYTARPVPQFDPPVLVLPALPAEPTDQAPPSEAEDRGPETGIKQPLPAGGDTGTEEEGSSQGPPPGEKAPEGNPPA